MSPYERVAEFIIESRQITAKSLKHVVLEAYEADDDYGRAVYKVAYRWGHEWGWFQVLALFDDIYKLREYAHA